MSRGSLFSFIFQVTINCFLCTDIFACLTRLSRFFWKTGAQTKQVTNTAQVTQIFVDTLVNVWFDTGSDFKKIPFRILKKLVKKKVMSNNGKNRQAELLRLWVIMERIDKLNFYILSVVWMNSFIMSPSIRVRQAHYLLCHGREKEEK